MRPHPLAPTALLALAMLAAPPPAGAQPPDAQGRRVDALFAAWDRSDSPGAAVAVIREGVVVHARGYGLANLEYDVPITPSTVFHVASVSKHFTAFAVLLLAAEGRLSLDDDIRTHVPEVPDFGRRITLRHLIHHTSGLRDQWELLSMGGWRLDDVITRDQILRLVRHQKELNFEPGSEYLYCNTGYTLLAVAVERVTGGSFREFTDARIFKPLGMHQTHFHDDHRHLVKYRAYSYTPAPGGGYRHSPLSYANVGATSLFTTVEDMAKWDRNFQEPRVGSQALLDQMLVQGVLNNNRTIPYAHALTIAEHRGLRTISHGGSDAGYRSFYVRFPAQKLSVVVLSNLSTLNPARLAHQVAEIYLEGQLRTPAPEPASTARSGAGGAPEAATRPVSRDEPAALTDYIGRYYSEELDTSYRLAVEDGRLVAHHRRHDDVPLSPIGRDRFAGEPFWFRTLEFTRDAEGRVSGFRLTAGRARNVRFDRQ